MRKLTAITHVSLDGVIQAPGGPHEDPRNSFPHGGWIMPFGDRALGQALDEIMAGEFDLLLGRRTYEIFAAYWPYAGEGTIANAFNRAGKHVVTNSLDRCDWAHTQLLAGDAVESVRRLKTTAGPELHLWGSGELLQTLIAADLVDEFRVWTYPVVLGQGRRLFEPGAPPRALTLASTLITSKGVLLNTYHPAGTVPQAPIPPDTPSEVELARREKLAGE